MATLTHDPDHAPRGVARLIERYRRPRTSALLASWLGEVQAVEDALWQLLTERSLATAEGDQLDVLGAIVGEPRQGRDDETYRLWISARTQVLRSSGTTTEILAIARKLVPADRGIRLEEYYPAAMLVRVVGGVLTIADGYQIARMLHLAKAAGVLFGLTWTVVADAGTFAFAPLVDTPVLDSDIGFDRGAWSVVADGTYLPPEDGDVPSGQLMIQGRPLVIQGVPVVITTGALRLPAMRALPASRLPLTLSLPVSRPLVARSVHIVPRALPAPEPLALPASIELADAFGDTSLEMTAAGDQFRVTLAVQDARLPFALRKVSTDATIAEEIGVLRFNRSRYDASWTVRLVAELDVAAVGQTATLQLYSLNDGVLRATLSTTATTTTRCATALSALPAADVLYSVRLARSGGAAGELVSCRAAMLEITHG